MPLALIMAISFGQTNPQPMRTYFALGAGFSLAAEALVMLILDFFAEARGHAYESALLGFKF